MKVIAWEYSSLYSHSLPLGAFMQMPLAAKSNERQLCFYHYLPSAWWLRRPNCIVQSNPTLRAFAQYGNLIITDSFLCPGGIKAHTSFRQN